MQNSKTFGICATCQRHTPLTKPHLVPKKRHKKKKRISDDTVLNTVIYICRTCHDGIHDFYDERTLAERFNSLEKLCADETLKKHFAWVAKCKKGMR